MTGKQPAHPLTGAFSGSQSQLRPEHVATDTEWRPDLRLYHCKGEQGFERVRGEGCRCRWGASISLARRGSIGETSRESSFVGRSVGVGPISPTRQHAFVRNSDFGCKKRRRGIGHLVLQSHSLSCRAVDNLSMMERGVCGEL